jgi:hypothetical protein
MRTIAMVALATSLASWAAGTTYADTSWPAFEQSRAKSSANTASNDSRGTSVTGQQERQQVGSVATERPEQHRAHGKHRARPLASTVKDHPKRAPNSSARLPSGKAVMSERSSVSAGAQWLPGLKALWVCLQTPRNSLHYPTTRAIAALIRQSSEEPRIQPIRMRRLADQVCAVSHEE